MSKTPKDEEKKWASGFNTEIDNNESIHNSQNVSKINKYKLFIRIILVANLFVALSMTILLFLVISVSIDQIGKDNRFISVGIIAFILLILIVMFMFVEQRFLKIIKDITAKPILKLLIKHLSFGTAISFLIGMFAYYLASIHCINTCKVTVSTTSSLLIAILLGISAFILGMAWLYLPIWLALKLPRQYIKALKLY